MKRTGSCLIVAIIFLLLAAPFIRTSDATLGETTYKRLTDAANGKKDPSLLEKLNVESKKIQWKDALKDEFVGNLRIVKKKGGNSSKTGSWVYLVRKLTGELFILFVPENMDQLDSSSPYFNLDSAFESKTLFKLKTMEKTNLIVFRILLCV